MLYGFVSGWQTEDRKGVIYVKKQSSTKAPKLSPAQKAVAKRTNREFTILVMDEIKRRGKDASEGYELFVGVVDSDGVLQWGSIGVLKKQYRAQFTLEAMLGFINKYSTHPLGGLFGGY